MQQTDVTQNNTHRTNRSLRAASEMPLAAALAPAAEPPPPDAPPLAIRCGGRMEEAAASSASAAASSSRVLSSALYWRCTLPHDVGSPHAMKACMQILAVVGHCEHAQHVRVLCSAHRTCADRGGTRKHHASARVPILQNPSVGQGSAWLARPAHRLFSPSARSMGGVAHACARCMVCRTRAQLRRRAFCRILQNCAQWCVGSGIGRGARTGQAPVYVLEVVVLWRSRA